MAYYILHTNGQLLEKSTIAQSMVLTLSVRDALRFSTIDGIYQFLLGQHQKSNLSVYRSRTIVYIRDNIVYYDMVYPKRVNLFRSVTPDEAIIATILAK